MTADAIAIEGDTSIGNTAIGGDIPRAVSLSTATTTTEQPDDRRDVFPFFDLPRELRDFVYDEVLVPDISMDLNCGLRLKATNTMRANLMAVNLQFAAEYKERAGKKGLLVLSDTFAFAPTSYTAIPCLPPAVRSIENVRVNIADLEIGFGAHVEWLNDVASGPNLKAISIKAVSDCDLADDDQDGYLMQRCQALTQLPKLSSLEVFEECGTASIFNFEAQDRIVWRWSAEKRALEKVTPKASIPDKGK